MFHDTIISKPDLVGLIDKDILKRFENVDVTYDTVINAQILKTNKEILEILKSKNNGV